MNDDTQQQKQRVAAVKTTIESFPCCTNVAYNIVSP